MERPSKKIPRSPAPKERTNFEVVVERVEDLDFDMERVFERFDGFDDSIKNLGNNYEDLCKRSAAPDDVKDLIKRVQHLENVSELLEAGLTAVEEYQGFKSRALERRRILTHMAAGGGQHSTNEDEDARLIAERVAEPSLSPAQAVMMVNGEVAGTVKPITKTSGAAGEPSRQWTPAKKDPTMELKVIQDLYRMAQTKSGTIVSAKNVVQVYQGFLDDLDALNGIKQLIEKALGPFALPGESLDATAARIGTVANEMFEVKTPEHSPHVWSIFCPGHAPEDECETCSKKAKELNEALSQAIESVLVWTLKGGAGFKKYILGRNIGAAMISIINPAISVTGIDGSCLKEVTDFAKLSLDEYFEMVY